MSKLDGRCGPGEALYGNRDILHHGDEFTRDANDYVRFSVGMTINVPTGAGSTAKLRLSSQSGMSRYVVQHWQAGDNAPEHYLCGDTGGVKLSSRIFEGT